MNQHHLKNFYYLISFLASIVTGDFDDAHRQHHNHKRSAVDTSLYLKQIQWPKVDLTYSLIGNVASKNQTQTRAVENTLRDAFDEWERNSCFRFTRIIRNLSNADIKIIFTNDRNYAQINQQQQQKQQQLNGTNVQNNYYHRNCTRKFRGSVAHAFFRYNKKFPAHIHVNNEMFWIESRPMSGSISLRTIILHEIGHIMGLFHSSDAESVMFEYVYTNQVKRISPGDRAELAKIYKDLCKTKRRRVSFIKFG
jgi:predicted Zn-dependent protease